MVGVNRPFCLFDKVLNLSGKEKIACANGWSNSKKKSRVKSTDIGCYLLFMVLICYLITGGIDKPYLPKDLVIQMVYER